MKDKKTTDPEPKKEQKKTLIELTKEGWKISNDQMQTMSELAQRVLQIGAVSAVKKEAISTLAKQGEELQAKGNKLASEKSKVTIQEIMDLTNQLNSINQRLYGMWSMVLEDSLGA